MRRKIVYQSQQYGCGYSAIKNLCYEISGNKDYLYAPEPKIVDDNIPSLKDLISYGLSLGLTLKAYRLNRKEEFSKDEKVPLLALLEINKQTHLVCVTRIKKNSVLIKDSARGELQINADEFLSIFLGVILHVIEFRCVERSFVKPIIIPKRESICLFISQLFPVLFLLAGIAALSFSSYLAIPASLFGLFIVSFLINIKLQSKALNRFDQKFLLNIDDEKPIKRKENFEHYNKYKKLLFTSKEELVSNIITLFFFSIYLTINDFYLGIMICILFALKIIDELIFSKRVNKEIDELSTEENYFYSTNESSCFRNSILINITKKANLIAKKIMINESIIYGVTILLTIPIFLINKDRYSIKDIVFSLLTLVYLEYNISKIFKMSRNLKQKQIEEAYFIGNLLDNKTNSGAQNIVENE